MNDQGLPSEKKSFIEKAPLLLLLLPPLISFIIVTIIAVLFLKRN